MTLTIPVFVDLGKLRDPPEPPAPFQMKPYKPSAALRANVARAREVQPPVIALAGSPATDRDWPL